MRLSTPQPESSHIPATHSQESAQALPERLHRSTQVVSRPKFGWQQQMPSGLRIQLYMSEKQHAHLQDAEELQLGSKGHVAGIAGMHGIACALHEHRHAAAAAQRLRLGLPGIIACPWCAGRLGIPAYNRETLRGSACGQIAAGAMPCANPRVSDGGHQPAQLTWG